MKTKYDQVITVRCGDDEHRILVTEIRQKTYPRQYTVESLDHSEKTVKAFAAFSATPPLCTRLVPHLLAAFEAYATARFDRWWWVEWETEIGSNRLDINMMSVENVRDEMRQAEREADTRADKWRDRIDALEKKLTGVDVDDEHIRWQIEEYESRIEEEEQVYWDWVEALEYAETVEDAAMKAGQASERVFDALMLGDFDKAARHAAFMYKQAQRGDNPDHYEPLAVAVRNIQRELKQ